ncbi:hypothetical protein T484DRAFT_1804194, partial [Baffinella frigidus]
MREVHTIIDDSEPDDQEGDMVGSSAGDDGGMSELKRQLKAKRAERVKAETLFRRLKDEEEDLAALIDTMERHEQDQGNFEWSEKVEALLRNTFNLSEFRPLQRN